MLEELSDFEFVMEGLADDGAPSAYYQTDRTRELSISLGDVLYKIQDLEVGSQYKVQDLEVGSLLPSIILMVSRQMNAVKESPSV